MSTHNICFHGEIRKLSILFGNKNVLPGTVVTESQEIIIMGF